MSRLCRDTSFRSSWIQISRRSDTRLVRLLDETFLFASSLSFAVVSCPTPTFVRLLYPCFDRHSFTLCHVVSNITIIIYVYAELGGVIRLHLYSR